MDKCVSRIIRTGSTPSLPSSRVVKLGIVGFDGIDPHHDGIHPVTQFMNIIPGGLAGDPFGVPGPGGDAAVQGCRAF